LDGNTPAEAAGGASKLSIKLDNFHWQTHCKGLYQLPIAARKRIRQGQVYFQSLHVTKLKARDFS